jgi:WD40 repeat protein
VERHPDERIVLTGSYDGTAKLWNVKSGRLLATLKGMTTRCPQWRGALTAPRR